MRTYPSLVFGLLVASVALAIDEHTVEIPTGGQAIVEVVRAKQSVHAKITTTVISAARRTPDDLTLGEQECRGAGGSCSLVTGLEISVNGRQIFVPRSSFRGLRNVRTVQLVAKRTSFQLVLRGGDGAEGFLATLVFNQDRVFKSLIASSLAPEDVLEETSYRIQKESFDR